ncbi:MAG: hypothetical protein IH935_08580, partial [Acidobacteria bacterium]|nr:hypothetical protein [Acidobacteriota bacterium]
MPERAQLAYPLDAESFGTLKITMPDILKELARSQAITLVSGDVTFDVRNTNVMSISASASVTIATITNGFDGQVLTLIFNDSNVTITDDSGGATATVDLNSAFVSANGSILVLVHNGTSWQEIDRNSSDVSGPASSTDNAIVRWDGTDGTDLQNSVVTIAD